MTMNNEVFKPSTTQAMPPREVIKVVGVGGGGGNALNNIIASEVVDVDFIAVNTDVVALELSKAPTKIVLGTKLTGGRGAGADPARGKEAAQESTEDLKAVLEGADMVFITAGMGGGTGTGASPIIAEIAKELGALTVAVVTMPFSWEGPMRAQNAQRGVNELRDKVDALIIIENDKLLEVCDKGTSFFEAFQVADDVLRQAVAGVTGMIRKAALVHVDFADVCTIMRGAGTAIMGIGEAKGEGRTVAAARAAMSGPMMTAPMSGATGLLYFIEVSPEVGLHEINEANQVIAQAAQENANIIWGWAPDPAMEDRVRFTIIATGFNGTGAIRRQNRQVSSAHFDSPRGAGQRRSGLNLNPADLVSDDEDDFLNVGGDDSYDTPAISRRARKK